MSLPTATSDSGVQIPECAFKEIEMLEYAYEDSKGDPWRDHPWIDGEALYKSLYRDRLTETVKDEFLKVQVSNLNIFCSRQDPDASWLRDFLSDAVMFFKLHKTWRVYICPSCDPLRWFPHNDSLVLHLMYEHSHALPFLRVNPAEVRWCSQALHGTVWKPIDVRAALNTLSTINTRLDTYHLCSLEWPLSEDCRRCELLAQLQKLFEVLLDSRDQDSFALISGGCLRALIAVASEQVLRHLDPMNILPPPFRSLLCCSLLSFRFMEEDPLVRFVSLMEGICKPTQASQNIELEGGKDDDVSCTKSECPDAVSFSADPDYFFLDPTKLNFCGADDMGSWLFKAPYFPTIEKLPAKASEILQLAEKKAVSFSECLGTVHAESDLKLLTSCLKILNMRHWPIPFLDTSSPELASKCEYSSAVAKDTPSPSCYSFRVPSKRQRTEFDSGPYLELIKLAWVLQFFELQVCRLCDFDLRDYVLPLLKSFLRMKSYLCIRTGPVFVPEEVKKEDASEGNKLLEGLRRVLPDMISIATPELRSSGIIAISVPGDSAHYPMMIHGGDSSASQVASPHEALSRMRTSMAAAIAESGAIPEAMPESDAEPKSKAEAKSQLSQDAQGPLCSVFDMFPDSDSIYRSEVRSIDAGIEMKEFPEKKLFEMKEFSTVAWLMREQCALENKENGLFVCMTVNDVMKHCLEGHDSKTAHTIWGWRSIRTRNHWRCFECNKRFPDQKSHMLHLGLSWDNDLSGPTIQVQQEGQSGVNEGFNESTRRLDDSITVDCSFRRFIVEIGKFESSCQDEEGGQELGQIYSDKLKEIRFLEDMCAESTSEVDDEDAEILQKFAKLNTSKQYLSNFCASDYKVEILPSIHSFMKKHMDSTVRSWALRRLTILLRDVRCPRLGLPPSFSIDLESPGQVIVNIEESNAGISFAYLGIKWKFSGDVSFKEPKKIKGTFMYSGISNADDCFHYSSEVILDEEIKTMKMFYFRGTLETNLEMDLSDKLLQFQAEFREKFQKI